MINDRYLFRGFHKEENGKETIYIDGQVIKGKWVYGSLASYPNNVYEIWNIQMGRCCLSTEHFKVIPETIGQWSGLDDMNKKKIFENDIVCISAYSFEEPEFDGDFKVKYDVIVGCWFFINIDDKEDFFTIEELRNHYRLDIKVIGTIFDKEVKDEYK